MIRMATAHVDHWVDGDTLEVTEIDPGWGVQLRSTSKKRQTMHVRLVGINTPDTRKNAKWCDPHLAANASAYVAEAYPAGTPLELISYALDDFGRTLATVVAVRDDGTRVDVAADLVAKGFARTGDYPTPAPEE